MRRFWLLFGLFLFALLAGCGQQGPSSNGGGNNQASSQAVATTLQEAEVQLFKITEPLGKAGFPIPLVPLLLSEDVAPLDTATWNCDSMTATGNLSDADDDGIPVNATFNGKCTWSYSGSEGSVSGSWEFQNLNVQDPNDADPTAGVKASGKVIWTFSAGGSTITWTWTLTQHDFEKGSSGYSFTYRGSWTIETSQGTFTEAYDLTGTWAPDDASDPWGDGVLSATGHFSGGGPSCTNGWSLDVTLTSLHYQGDKIVSGNASFSGTDCNGNTGSVTITWSPDQVCVKIDGNTVCADQ